MSAELPSTDPQDAEDMRRLAGGHDAALNDLMERHGQRLFHYLYRQLQNEADAADLAQDTFVRVYQHRANFKQGARFSTWLYTIATNLVRDRFRFRARHPDVSLEAEDDSERSLQEVLPDTRSTPPQMLEAEERAETVRRAIAQLPEDLRTPLILVEYEERSQAEIAAILKCSVKAVEMRVYRARQLLKKSLAALVATG